MTANNICACKDDPTKWIKFGRISWVETKSTMLIINFHVASMWHMTTQGLAYEVNEKRGRGRRVKRSVGPMQSEESPCMSPKVSPSFP